MPFRWASSSKSCLQYKVRAHRFWLSRKADRDIIDIVFCDRFIFPKSPLMRRYFHERNKNISYMNFAFLICDVSIKTWINKEKHDFFTALLAQLTAHVNLPDSFIAPAHIGSYSQTSYEETVIACGIGIYQCNDCATGAAHTVCVCVCDENLFALCGHAPKLYWLPALDWLIDLYDMPWSRLGNIGWDLTKLHYSSVSVFIAASYFMWKYCNCLSGRRRSRM